MPRTKDPNTNTDFTILATKVPTKLAEEFSTRAKQDGTTVSRVLSNCIREYLGKTCSAQECTLTLKNVNRLFRLAGQYSVGKNPNELVNIILDQYFNTLEKTVKL